MIQPISSRLLFFIFVFCSNSNFGIAQINVDSLSLIWKNIENSDSVRFDAINTYYKNQTQAQPDSVLVLSKYHLDLAIEKDSKSEMSKAHNEKSYAYYLKGDTKKSMESLLVSIELLEQLDKPIALASVYSNIGNIYGEENKYEEAARYFYKTLKIFEDNNVQTGEARMLHNIGLIYYLIDSPELALDHMQKSQNIYLELGLDQKAKTVKSDIGAVYYQQGKYHDAIMECEEAVATLLQTNNKYSVADCYFTLAKAYSQTSNKARAKEYLDKSLEIDHQIKNTAKIIERLTFDAELVLDSDIAKATEKAEKVLQLLDTDTKNNLKVELYELLYKCYKSQDKYNLSLAMYEKKVLYNDSLQLQKNKTAIIREAIQKDYQGKLKEQQIENVKIQSKLRSTHATKMWRIAGACLIIVFVIGMYSRSVINGNQKERQSLLEELQKLKQIDATLVTQPSRFELDRDKLEENIDRKINETDWTVLNILLDDPVISNADIAKQAYMSVDGIGSSLRRMYEYFDVKESKYKKISLLMLAIKISNGSRIV